jgi:hypothetical protein
VLGSEKDSGGKDCERRKENRGKDGGEEGTERCEREKETKGKKKGIASQPARDWIPFSLNVNNALPLVELPSLK